MQFYLAITIVSCSVTYCVVDITVLVECDESIVSFESETDLCMNPAAMETVVVAGLIVRPIGGAVMH